MPSESEARRWILAFADEYETIKLEREGKEYELIRAGYKERPTFVIVADSEASQVLYSHHTRLSEREVIWPKADRPQVLSKYIGSRLEVSDWAERTPAQEHKDKGAA